MATESMPPFPKTVEKYAQKILLLPFPISPFLNFYPSPHLIFRVTENLYTRGTT